MGKDELLRTNRGRGRYRNRDREGASWALATKLGQRGYAVHEELYEYQAEENDTDSDPAHILIHLYM